MSVLQRVVRAVVPYAVAGEAVAGAGVEHPVNGREPRRDVAEGLQVADGVRVGYLVALHDLRREACRERFSERLGDTAGDDIPVVLDPCPVVRIG